MELEALQGINSEVLALGAQIVVLTPELERYTRALHKKLNLSFAHSDRSAPENRRRVPAGFHTAGLLARALQVIRQCPGQIS
jgi:hypothetical protein